MTTPLTIADLIIKHDEHGLWATDGGNCFFIEEGFDGKPYLLSGPIMAATNEPPWEDIGQGYEIGEVAWGCIDDVDYCRAVEARLVAAWEAAGRPKPGIPNANVTYEITAERCPHGVIMDDAPCATCFGETP